MKTLFHQRCQPWGPCLRAGHALFHLSFILLLFVTAAAPAEPVPQRGGTLRLALPTDISSLDPTLAFDTISAPFLMLVYQGLVEYDDGVKLRPALATGWHLSADRKTYTFHLRSGTRFSSGRELVAGDFVYSLERNLDPKTDGLSEAYFEGIAGAKDFRAGKAPHVRGLRAPRPDTLEIELTAPDPTLLFLLTLPGGLVLPREAVESGGACFASHPVGTGPYVLAGWQRGVKMRFERNPFYPRAERQNLDAIEVREGGDAALHLMMFERGELDIADVTMSPGVPIPDFLRIQRTPRWQGLVESMPASFTWFLALNTEMPPFDELKVRQAVNYAIDKDKIVHMLHNTIMAAPGILPPPMPGFNPHLAGIPYDPAKARQLLAASGHAGGFTCKLWFEAANAILISAAASIQYDLKQVGIDVQLNPVTLPAFLNVSERRKAMQCGLTGWSQDYPDPSDFLDTLFNGTLITEEGCQNTAFYNNPQVNQWLGNAAACADPDQRIAIYQKVEQTLVNEAPFVPLFYQRVFLLHQPRLHGAKIHPVLYFRFERMWLEH